MNSTVESQKIKKQMLDRRSVELIGQVEEIGEEQGVILQTVRSWEKRCDSCFLIHGGECW